MKKNVLVIDDSAPIRFLLEAILGKNYTVTAVPDGLMAMSWLKRGGTPNLIITDLHMPNIDGWELVKYLSNSHLYNDIPVIVLSAAPDPGQTDNFHNYQNVHAVFGKPFDPMHLSATVAEILDEQPVLQG